MWSGVRDGLQQVGELYNGPAGGPSDYVRRSRTANCGLMVGKDYVASPYGISGCLYCGIAMRIKVRCPPGAVPTQVTTAT